MPMQITKIHTDSAHISFDRRTGKFSIWLNDIDGDESDSLVYVLSDIALNIDGGTDEEYSNDLQLLDLLNAHYNK